MALYLICDESGAKGGANVPEKKPGEVGIFAGYFLLGEQVAPVRHDLDAICAPFRQPDGKLHVAEMGAPAQALRQQVFAYLLAHDIDCAYAAIHPQGFHVNFLGQGEGAVNESLHSELFLGLFAKAVAYREDRGLTDRPLRVLTDRIDKGVRRGFNRAVAEFLNEDAVEETVSRYVPETGALEQLDVTWTFTHDLPDEWEIALIAADEYAIEVDQENGSLTAAADVIAGSLRHFFEGRSGTRLGGLLSRHDSVAGHPIEPRVYGLTAPGGYAPLGDTIYRHPVEVTRGEVEELLAAADAAAADDRLRELVRFRAYLIHRQNKDPKPAPEADWIQARAELGVPAGRWL
jgi:hypothetical protein